ncbi:MAG: immunoglobulin domain-containing protein [Verrucomicrobiota bacterium]
MKQPNAAAVLVGGSLTLSVSAKGSGPLTYQWRKRGKVGVTLLAENQYDDRGDTSLVSDPIEYAAWNEVETLLEKDNVGMGRGFIIPTAWLGNFL